MDPISITSGCVGLLTGIAHLTSQITSFVSSVRDARKDMAAVSGELVSLSLCLETLRDDSMKIKYPEAFNENLLTVLKNCDTVTIEMTTLLGKLSSANLIRKIQWSAMGRDDMNKLRSSLESHKSALEIGLDMTSLLIISAVKSEVAEVKADTAQIPSIKQDTSQIEGLVQQIDLLRLQLENIHMKDAKARHLQMFLDQSTSYAETVMDSIHEEAGKPYATEGFESDESEYEQEVFSTINITKSMVTPKQHPQQRGYFYTESSHYNSDAKNPYQQDGGYYEGHQGHKDSYYQDQYYDQNGLNDNEMAAEAAPDSDSETSDQPPTVRDYATQSTTNTSAFSRNGTTAIATDNLESGRASRQPAKAPGHYPRKPGALSSDARVLLPCRDKEAIKKATLLRNAMTQKEQDRLHRSLEVVIRGRRSLADRLKNKKGPWQTTDRGDVATIEKLLDRGADPNRLSYGYDLCTIEMEGFFKSLPFVKILLYRGAHFQLSAAGQWMMEVIDWGHGLAIDERLRLVAGFLDCGVSPNTKDAFGVSALSHACQTFRCHETVKLLLDRGAIANGAALKAALGRRIGVDRGTVQLLLDRGAIANGAALKAALGRRIGVDLGTVQLLLDRGAIANDAALEAAVRRNFHPEFFAGENLEAVRMLLGHKTTSISTAGKESAAKYAADWKNWPLVNILLKHAASLAVNTPVVQREIFAHRRRLPQSYERTPS